MAAKRRSAGKVDEKAAETVVALRRQLRASDNARSEAKGRLSAVLEKLSTEFDIRSLDDAQDAREEMEKDLEELERELEQLLAELETEVGG